LEAEERAAQGLEPDAAPVIGESEQRSFADGDARMMLLKRGEYAYAHNAEAAVDDAHGVIVAAELTNIAPDVGHLPGLVARVRALRATGPSDAAATTVSADAGYFSVENIAQDGDGIDLLIAGDRGDPRAAPLPEAGRVWAADAFGYDPARDVWICPADKLLARQVTSPGTRGRPPKDRYLGDPADCGLCPLRAVCLKPGQDRRVLVAQRSRPTGAMRHKLRHPDARRR
jgi:hypothetical protein